MIYQLAIVSETHNMFEPNQLLKKAQNSIFYRWLLNQSLSWTIPFNRPHGFKVMEIGDRQIKTWLPYKKRNMNHIKGIHACALATISEFTTGLLLIHLLGAKNYRLILKQLEMEYHYQGKMTATATFAIDQVWLDEQVYHPLAQNTSVIVVCAIQVHDVNGNHLSTGQVHWQLKAWDHVKTKM